MKLFYFFLLIFLSGCSLKTIPIKGTYLKTPYIITSDKNFEQVWDKLIDLFAQKGLPIKIIDKNSGLIISEKLILPITIELKSGQLKNPSAFIVVAQVYDPGSRKYYPIGRYYNSIFGVSGEWNVRIKKNDDKTIINVNLVNVTYEYELAHVPKQILLKEYQSTGVFENLIADAIK